MIKTPGREFKLFIDIQVQVHLQMGIGILASIGLMEWYNLYVKKKELLNNAFLYIRYDHQLSHNQYKNKI